MPMPARPWGLATVTRKRYFIQAVFFFRVGTPPDADRQSGTPVEAGRLPSCRRRPSGPPAG